MLIKYTDNVSIRPIDDSIDSMSLEALKNEILENNGVVYLALSKLPNDYETRRDNLIKKLEINNIPYKDGEILNYAEKAIQKLKQECKSKGWDRIFTFVLPDYVKDKHFGNLVLELEQRGEKILYFCSQEGSFLRALEKSDKSKNCLLYLSYEYLHLIDFTTAVCVTGKYDVHKDAKIIFIGHSLTNFSSYDDIFMLENFKDSYICVAGEEFKPHESLGFKVINSGYLAYDSGVERLKNIKFSKDCVFFAPCDLEELKEAKPLIEEILQKYKVILRHRYEWKESHLEILGELAKNIEIDMSVPMDYQIYGRSFVAVCSKTTMKNSFPLMALSPSLVLGNKDSFSGNALDENLGILVDSKFSAGGGGIFGFN